MAMQSHKIYSGKKKMTESGGGKRAISLGHVLIVT